MRWKHRYIFIVKIIIVITKINNFSSLHTIYLKKL